MGYKSVFTATLRILGQNKIVWFFSLLIATIEIPLRLENNLILLSCFLNLAIVYLGSIGYLGMILTLYHSYLGQSVKLKDVWKESGSFALLWIALVLFILVIAIVPVIAIVQFTRRLPFVLAELILIFPLTYFLAFFFNYLLLDMIRNKSIMVKHAAQVWSKNARLQLVLAFIYSLILLVLQLVIIITRKGFSPSLLFISQYDYSVLSQTLMAHLINGIYAWVVDPLVVTVLMLIYMKSIDNNNVIQNTVQSDLESQPPS